MHQDKYAKYKTKYMLAKRNNQYGGNMVNISELHINPNSSEEIITKDFVVTISNTSTVAELKQLLLDGKYRGIHDIVIYRRNDNPPQNPRFIKLDLSSILGHNDIFITKYIDNKLYQDINVSVEYVSGVPVIPQLTVLWHSTINDVKKQIDNNVDFEYFLINPRNPGTNLLDHIDIPVLEVIKFNDILHVVKKSDIAVLKSMDMLAINNDYHGGHDYYVSPFNATDSHGKLLRYPYQDADHEYCKIIELDISFINIPIPTEIVKLTNLNFLTIQKNLVNIPIPTEIFQLTNLNRLHLERNNFIGPIPTEIGRLNQLQELYIISGTLTGQIPTEICRLNQLTRLRIKQTRLDGHIPTEIGRLNQLTRLKIDHNQLTGPIPTEIGQLNQLTRIDISHNQLAGHIPTEIGQLKQLTSIYINHNQLAGHIPTEIGQLNQLRYLDISQNQFTRHILTEIDELTHVKVIY